MGKMMVRNRKWMFFILLVSGVSVFFFLETRAVESFSERFDAVHLGMHETKVIELFGAPYDESSSFYLGQEKGFEKVYQQARLSSSVKYLSWHIGIDCVFTVGVDQYEKVTIAEYGCT